MHTLYTDSASTLGEFQNLLRLFGAPSYAHAVPRGNMSESRQISNAADADQLPSTRDRETTT